MKCPRCGAPLKEKTNFCVFCGEKLKWCPVCNEAMRADAKFCPNDGTPLEQAESTPPQETVPAPPAEPDYPDNTVLMPKMPQPEEPDYPDNTVLVAKIHQPQEPEYPDDTVVIPGAVPHYGQQPVQAEGDNALAQPEIRRKEEKRDTAPIPPIPETPVDIPMEDPEEREDTAEDFDFSQEEEKNRRFEEASASILQSMENCRLREQVRPGVTSFREEERQAARQEHLERRQERHTKPPREQEPPAPPEPPREQEPPAPSEPPREKEESNAPMIAAIAILIVLLVLGTVLVVSKLAPTLVNPPQKPAETQTAEPEDTTPSKPLPEKKPEEAPEEQPQPEQLPEEQPEEPTPEEEPVTPSVTLNKTEITFTRAGETETLEAVAENTQETLKFISMNPAVAQVDESGVVTAVSTGTTKILARSGSVQAECEVICELAPAEPEEPEEETPAEEPEEQEMVKSDRYMLQGSDTRLISDADLNGMSAWECKVARNEIYARHGLMFGDENLQKYFEGCSWYKGTVAKGHSDEIPLSDIEAANAETIKAYEREKGYVQ